LMLVLGAQAAAAQPDPALYRCSTIVTGTDLLVDGGVVASLTAQG
ncbi:MAG: hypothetical protein INR66_15465, partial [Gordonia polyisoprenivorans]|nr:hypothetical protein [Gordonia polyisoprenivorans]